MQWIHFLTFPLPISDNNFSFELTFYFQTTISLKKKTLGNVCGVFMKLVTTGLIPLRCLGLMDRPDFLRLSLTLYLLKIRISDRHD